MTIVAADPFRLLKSKRLLRDDSPTLNLGEGHRSPKLLHVLNVAISMGVGLAGVPS